MDSLIKSKKLIWITALFTALITFITFLPALQNGFVNWDDQLYVYGNQNIKAINLDFLRWSLTTEVAGLWHPLTIFSLALDYTIWGLNPFGYHLTNILFHTANTFLVFILVVRLIKCVLYSSSVGPRPLIILAASVTALLFGVHPFRVESVVWGSERKDVLCAFFFLLSILSYLKYSYGPSKRHVAYATSLSFFILALMSKPMAVSLPLVLIILDFYPLKRLKVGYRGILTEKLPFFMLSILAALVTIQASTEGLAEDLPLTARIIIAVNAWIFYLFKMILPFKLAPLYPLQAPINFLALQYIVAILVFLSISFCSARLLKMEKLFFAVWLYYTVTLMPVLGILQVGDQYAADRYTYLPSLGPFFLAGLAITTVFKGCSKKECSQVVIGVLILMSALLGFKTIRQAAIWKDSITLWSHEINIYSNVEIAHYNRGNAYGAIGNYWQAIKDFDIVIELNPKKSMAFNNRGNAYYAIGNFDQAMNDYKKAVEVDPKNAEAYYNLGLTYSQIGDTEQALINYKKAAKLGLKEASNPPPPSSS